MDVLDLVGMKMKRVSPAERAFVITGVSPRNPHLLEHKTPPAAANATCPLLPPGTALACKQTSDAGCHACCLAFGGLQPCVV